VRSCLRQWKSILLVGKFKQGPINSEPFQQGNQEGGGKLGRNGALVNQDRDWGGGDDVLVNLPEE